MHELSIASSIIEVATRHLRDVGGGVVAAVTVKIGALAGVSEESLRTGFDVVREGTPLAGADMRVIRVPVAIWCPSCDRVVELAGLRALACPLCGTRSGDIRAGRELDLESIEIHASAATVEEQP